MRYSVANRFKGTLLGALVGESIASYILPDGNTLHWSQIAIATAEVLIEKHGRFDQIEWQHQTDGDVAANSTAIDILATLPIALFFHENTILLRDSLLQSVEKWRDLPALQEGGLALGYAIAQILNEKITPHNLIEETIAFVNVPSGIISQKLLTVSDLLKNSAGLATAQECFGSPQEQSNSIAMAFYCFLSTLEDFRLGTLRATNTSQTVILVQRAAQGAIAGALLGAYNSMVGIPVTWLMQDKAKLSPRIISFSRMLKLADVLAVMWSGAYDTRFKSEDLSHTEMFPMYGASHQAVAAPRVIR